MSAPRPLAAKRTAGVSLVEVLVALAVIGIAFGALAFAQLSGFRATRQSQDVVRTRDVATRVLEEIRADGYLSYVACDPGSTAQPYSWARPCNGAATIDGVDVRWSITNEPAGLPVLDPPALLGVQVVGLQADGDPYPLYSYLSCGDPGDASMSNDPCPTESLRSAGPS